MNGKILKKYTTIPEHLYVNRIADTQLKAIIEEMQRPGYVLVARQMGKTNLLFHAKRTLENENRLFVYVDLSNLYENEQDCYRNIIDNILEPNATLFGPVEHEILKTRELQLPPHNEYSRSLRIVLNHFKGDLVIVLDEIDALKSIRYSDNIFAQIRSNYFSRTNFPEFERLTYVLSGVIEPTELIRDKNKSPFNIGDKIYLDDFTLDEHEAFITKSRLKIDSFISSEIFRWANGNPRLTFDICSAIEDDIIKDAAITKELIYAIIKQKYLTSFDIAPIDHIRELVRTSKEIRNAIKNIHNKKYAELSDEVKRKLYLYGIINSKFDEPTTIKNKIIEQSLTDEWIKSLEKRATSSLTYGLAQFDNKEYQETIETLQDYLGSGNPSVNEIEVSNYYIGRSFYYLREFEKAIEYFSKDYNTAPYNGNSKSFLGISKLATGDGEAGRAILEKIIEEPIEKYAYHNSLLNLAINLDSNESEKATALLERLFASTFEDGNEGKEEELNELRTLSLYYQGDLLYQKGQNSQAAQKVSEALKYASLPNSLVLTNFLYQLSSPKDKNLKHELVNRIISNNLLPEKYQSTPISFTEKHLNMYIGELFDGSDLSLVETLLEYTIQNVYKSTVPKYELAYTSVPASAPNRSHILNYLLANKANVPDETLILVYKELLNANTKHSDSFLNYFKSYLPLFQNPNFAVTSADIYLFALAIKINSDHFKIREALELCDILKQRITLSDDDDLKFESVIIYYWYSNLYFSQKDTEKAVWYADETLKIIENNSHKKASMIDEKGLKQIADQMIVIKRSSISNIPFVRSKKYGANEWVKVQYLDGSTAERKYKKVEADILAERCKIIEK
ncbi:MAG: hypothetical protein JWP78_2036 [Mucilaginibacter sp.]|nr:hypothetical protein [Mucilaginibacter sp.]